MPQRGFAQFVEVRVSPELAWAACTEEPWLRRWYAREAHVDPRSGGAFRVRTLDGRVRDATVDVWDPGRRLRLIYFPDREMLPLLGDGDGPLSEDLLFDTKPGRTVVRVFGSGIPDAREWDAYYQKLRLGWAYWLNALKRVLEPGAGDAPAATTPASPASRRKA
jgi:uncharacterized protein YndB with AHSA1/START domain